MELPFKHFLILTSIIILLFEVEFSYQRQRQQQRPRASNNNSTKRTRLVPGQRIAELEKKFESYRTEVEKQIGNIMEEFDRRLAILSEGLLAQESLPSASQTEPENQFLESPVFDNNKIFLHPKLASRKKGNWFQNYDICAAAAAADNSSSIEMVTIHSPSENEFLHKWVRSAEIGMKHPGAWIGAQIFDKEKAFSWSGAGVRSYANLAPWEFNEDGITCLTIGWDDARDWWYNWWCIDARLIVLCQKYI